MNIARSGPTLNRVPDVTVYFWAIKVLCATVGVTAAVLLSDDLGLGHAGAIGLISALLVAALAVQFRVRQYVPGIYWLAATLVGVLTGLVSDGLTANGVSQGAAALAFAAALGAVLAVWHISERTLSIHAVVTTRREALYWLAVLFAFALGASGGSLATDQLDLGANGTALLGAGLIAIVAVAHFVSGLDGVPAFWLAYVLTWPLGAALGDDLAQAPSGPAHDLGPALTCALALIAILGLVVYLSVTKLDLEVVPEPATR